MIVYDSNDGEEVRPGLIGKRTRTCRCLLGRNPSTELPTRVIVSSWGGQNWEGR